jgi:hypothetical protein
MRERGVSGGIGGRKMEEKVDKTHVKTWAVFQTKPFWREKSVNLGKITPKKESLFASLENCEYQ